MAPIVVSVEIVQNACGRLCYVTDPSHLPVWQESVVRVDSDDAPTHVGTRVVVVRRAGGREMESAAEFVSSNHPRAGACVASTARYVVTSRARSSHSTTEPDRASPSTSSCRERHRKAPASAFVQRQAKKEMPLNAQNLKELLESGGSHTG